MLHLKMPFIQGAQKTVKQLQLSQLFHLRGCLCLNFFAGFPRIKQFQWYFRSSQCNQFVACLQTSTHFCGTSVIVILFHFVPSLLFIDLIIIFFTCRSCPLNGAKLWKMRKSLATIITRSTLRSYARSIHRVFLSLVRYRELKQRRRLRRKRHLAKMNLLCFTSKIRDCLDMFGTPMALKTFPRQTSSDSVQFQMEILKISRSR